MGPNGDIYLAQGGEERVAVFGPDGRPRPSIGRAGEGPGEFVGAPTRIVWHGDTLVVTERGATHFLDREGREFRRVQFRMRVPTESSTFINGTPLADGTFLGIRFLNPPIRTFVTARDLPILRFSPMGDVIDTIARVNHVVGPVGDDAFLREFENKWLHHPLGWFEHDSWLPFAVTEDRAAVVFVDRVDEREPASFHLLEIAITGDTIFDRVIRYRPLEISRAESTRIREGFGQLIAGGTSRSQGSTAREFEAAREALVLPRHYPPVRRIVTGDDGTIWLLRETSPRPADVWEIYGPDGGFEGAAEFELPGHGRPWEPKLTILSATREEVWGLRVDELGVESIGRFRVVRACRP